MTKTGAISVRQLVEGDVISGKVITIYAATRPEDLEEGRGPTVDNSYHLTEREALMGTSRIGVMGGDGEVEPRLALELSDDRYALAPRLIEISKNPEGEAKLREEALGKLSPAERAALFGKGEN